MAGNLITIATQEGLNTYSVLTEGKSRNPRDETAAGNINKNTDDLVKKEWLTRQAEELLKYLYTATDQIRYRNLVCSVCRRNEDLESENDDLFECDDCYLEYDTYDLIRHKRTNYRRAKKDQTPFKEKKFISFCRENKTPEKITLEKGKKNAIRVTYNRCVKQMSKDANRRDHNERRKANINKRLDKRGVKRRGTNIVDRTDGGSLECPEAIKFQLCDENAPEEMSNLFDFLVSLQTREVTPEDYEFLLKLDDLIPKKTVSGERLSRLNKEAVEEAHVEELCAICMEKYEIGQIRTILPCKHNFHTNCIDQWLTQSSRSCPLDGQEI